jgi:tRNA(adenine34) deaminase
MYLENYMKAALAEAEKAARKGEVPVGCVAVRDGKIIARAHNLRETTADPLAHAEILCLKKAAKKLKGWYLHRVVIYSTLEPCLMCAGAMIHARIKEVVFGASDPRAGASKIMKKFKIKTAKGVLGEDCGRVLKDFFRKLRKRSARRGVRAVEGARLESVYTGNRIESSNLSPSDQAT